MTEHVHEQLACYRDLTPGERRQVDAHLDVCAECRATLAAFDRQDAALTAICDIRPRRALHFDRFPIPRAGLARLGEVTLAGLGALIWLFGLQVQALAQGGGTLAPAALEPGLTLPPTRLSPPSPWLPALPWLAGSLFVVGALFIFTRKGLLPTLLGAALATLLLVSFIMPFSLLPNPVGLYYRVVGGYSYDPRLPFKNGFLIAGDPAATLRPYLDRLIGERGLSPLDPNSPLERYEILRVGLHPTQNNVALVTTRFIYADGSSRVYPVPLLRPLINFGGFWQSAWTEDGLQRLRSEHLAFPGQPFATEASPIRLGAVRQAQLHPDANRLDEANPAHWLWESVRVERLTVAPDGSAFLVAIETDAVRRQLWLVPFNGAAPVAVGAPGDIREYGFSPDGRYIVYTRVDPDALAADPASPFAITVVTRDSVPSVSSYVEVEHFLPNNLATGLASPQLPGLTADGVWFFSDGRLWRAPYAGGDSKLIADLSGVALPGFAPRPAPGGERVAFVCDNALCLLDLSTEAVTRIDGLQPAEMAWSVSGDRLAVIDRDPNNLRSVWLHVFAADGTEQLIVAVAPRDVTDPPQWTPDGRAIFVQTYPQDGRRIIAVDVVGGQVVDLSQEHWDAYFALMPDGRSLLLNNGRGDYWIVDVIFR
ncbi:MAG: zf-HC2 domain-containing protein [Anaerolineales bacterium]|nr:zf-HC2 domain-containing protein [Anaerolineales bacterium]